MIKLLKNKKLNSNDADINTLRLLRQQVTLNEQMKTYNAITENEYDENLNKISMYVKILEDKYEMD